MASRAVPRASGTVDFRDESAAIAPYILAFVYHASPTVLFFSTAITLSISVLASVSFFRDSRSLALSSFWACDKNPTTASNAVRNNFFIWKYLLFFSQ